MGGGRPGSKFSRLHAMHVHRLLAAHWQEWVIDRGMSRQQIAAVINAMKLPALADSSGLTGSIVGGVVRDMASLDPEAYAWPERQAAAAAAVEVDRLAALENKLALLHRQVEAFAESIDARVTALEKHPARGDGDPVRDLFPR